MAQTICLNSLICFLLIFDLRLLRFDLRLLFFEGVDEKDAEAVVFHAFDLSVFAENGEQRIDLRHVFRAETDIGRSAVFPVVGKSDLIVLSNPNRRKMRRRSFCNAGLMSR